MNGVRRNSSVELLRLLLMLLIVIHHGIVHGLGLTSLSSKFDSVLLFNPEEFPLILLVNSLCIVSVNCFVIISGYYRIKFSMQKLLYLISALLFYSILLNVLPALYQHNYYEAIKNSLFLSHSPYWFVIDYIFLMFFAPIFNMMFDKFNKRYIISLLVVMTFMSVYFGFMWNNKVNDNGYTFFQFIYLYCIGGILREIKLSSLLSLLIYVIGSALTAIIMFLLIKYGFNEWAWKMTYYNNPLIIISSVGLFYLFHNWTFHSNIINYVAKSALAVYLVQSSLLVSNALYSRIVGFWDNGYNTQGGVLIIICSLSVLVVLISLAIDSLRRVVFNLYVKCRTK